MKPPIASLTMNNCIFCKIIKKEIQSFIVYEDKEILAFLDAFPATKGQTLVIPKKHENYLFRMKNNEYENLWLVTKKIANAIDQSLAPLRTAIVVEGFQVSHVHIRLHPCYEKHLPLKPLDKKPSSEEMAQIAQKIQEQMVT